jgi:hypothetical protein
MGVFEYEGRDKEHVRRRGSGSLCGGVGMGRMDSKHGNLPVESSARMREEQLKDGRGE